MLMMYACYVIISPLYWFEMVTISSDHMLEQSLKGSASVTLCMPWC